jgi:hypothetical protein
MESGDYTIAWVSYGTAAVILSWLCWLILRKVRPRELGWLLQFWLLGLLFTPWYVLPDEEIMAPALIVFVMDAITVSKESSIRALIPLVMSLLLGLLLTFLLSAATRLLRRKG